jgi:uncharacterized tellurite resistance protein B-like protein
MVLRVLRAWLGVDERSESEQTPLRELIETLDHMEPDRARYLARFAYVLGRVAHADRHVSPDETRVMEAIVADEGRLSADQATVVVGLAKASNRLFGGTADFVVTQEFAEQASYEQKLALAQCLFAVASIDHAISVAEEAEIHRVLNQLKVLPQDLTAMRVEHGRFLPGLSGREPGPQE